MQGTITTTRFARQFRPSRIGIGAALIAVGLAIVAYTVSLPRIRLMAVVFGGVLVLAGGYVMTTAFATVCTQCKAFVVSMEFAFPMNVGHAVHAFATTGAGGEALFGVPPVTAADTERACLSARGCQQCFAVREVLGYRNVWAGQYFETKDMTTPRPATERDEALVRALAAERTPAIQDF